MSVILNESHFPGNPKAKAVLTSLGVACPDGWLFEDAAVANAAIEKITGVVPVMPPPRSAGLGDTVAKVFKVTGVAAAVKAVSKMTGVPCGCAGRQAKLNEMFPYDSPCP